MWSSYSKHYDRLNSLVAYEELLDQIVNNSYQYQRSPKRILDVGCGTGNLTYKLHLRFPDSLIDAFDSNEEMISFAKSKIQGEDNVNIKLLDITDRIEFDRLDKYDLVTINNVLYTVEDKKGTLINIKKKLSEEGIIILSDPVPVKDYKYSEIIKRQTKSVKSFLQTFKIIISLIKIFSINKNIDEKYPRSGVEEYVEIFDEIGLELKKNEKSYAGQANLFVLKIRDA